MKVKSLWLNSRLPARRAGWQVDAADGYARLLSVRIDRIRLSDLLGRATEAAVHRVRLTVMYVNVHCMNVHNKDPLYGEILRRADIVYCDGTGIQLAAWIAAQHIPERMTGADWIDDLCVAACKHELSLFLLGSAPGIAELAAERLQKQHPGLRIGGTASGFGAGQDVIACINRSRSDILLVGMGTPTQEKWIDAHRDQLDIPVVWAVGALFDFVTGKIPRGPRLLTRHGLEWMCRLAAEPRKLWRRYLIGNPQFFYRVIRHYWLPTR